MICGVAYVNIDGIDKIRLISMQLNVLGAFACEWFK